jgi:glycosyltransferase involved in cell wall biosynthesis
MDEDVTHFPDVTLLVTHFNRSRSLERLLQTLREQDTTFGGIVVSDDASKLEHLKRLEDLRETYGYRLVTTPVNRGLGNNLNKGQDAVTTPYTLYVQEDFTPTASFPKAFPTAREILEERADIDVVRMHYYSRYPSTTPYKNGFSEMVFKLGAPGSAKFFYYSDHPHLRRTSFFTKFGRYAEGIRAIKTEKCMVMSFLQAGGKAMIRDDNDLFVHENTIEPSTQDYSAFFRIRSKIPEPVFDLVWTVRLTAQYLVKPYRH